jgi:hypothetical protein
MENLNKSGTASPDLLTVEQAGETESDERLPPAKDTSFAGAFSLSRYNAESPNLSHNCPPW